MLNLLKKLFKRPNQDGLKLQAAYSHFFMARKQYNNLKNLSEAEYKAFSQNGEDGIIDYLLNQLNINEPKFVEIGIGDYSESNTRLLFEIRNVNGLVIDAIDDLKKKVLKNIKLWRNNLTILEKKVDSSNINEILKLKNFNENLDLFSLDIDGIDYWIIKELPENFAKIAVIEFNPNFGSLAKVTVPNINEFNRTAYHYSNLCFGASLAAIIQIMHSKNFVFIGTNQFRCNAFFVNKDYIEMIKVNIPNQNNIDEFVNSYFRESRDKEGNLNYLNKKDVLEKIKDCEVIDLNSGIEKKIKIKDIVSY